MTNLRKKILFCIFLTIIIICITSISKSAMLDKSWDLSKNGYVTEYDLVLKAHSSDWYEVDPKSLIGKEVYMNVGYYTENKVTINQAGAYCIGHGNTTTNSQAKYKITNIIDVDITGSKPGTVESYLENGQVVKTTASTSAGKAAVEVGYAAYKGRDIALVTGTIYENWKYLVFRLYGVNIDSFVNGLKLKKEYKVALNGNEYTYPNNSKVQEVLDYQSSVSKYKFEDKTSGTPKIQYKNGRSYLGPYKINHVQGTMKEATVTGGYTVLGYSTSVGGSVSAISNIPNNKNFYIVVDGNVSSKVTVTLKKTFNVKKARLLFVYNEQNGSGAQHIMIYRGNSGNRTYSLKLPTTENPNAKFKLVKLDNDVQTRLPNVQFRFTKDGQYLKKDGTLTTNINDDTIFTTDSNGEITINSMPVGTYKYYEVSNNNSGYEECQVIPENGTSISVVSYSGKSTVDLAKMVVEAIYTSQEAINARAKMSNEEFIKSVYKAVLGRDATSSEISKWKSQLDQGRNTTSERKVLDGVLDSAEFEDSVQNTDQYRKTLSTNLYVYFFQRDPWPNSEVGYWSNLMKGYSSFVVYNRKTIGNITITKVDKDTNQALANVGFKFQNVSTSKYIKLTNGTISYVDSKEDATEFFTDSKGNITVEGVKLGSYRAYETKNPNAGYIVNTDYVEIQTQTNKKITNEYQLGNLKIEKVDKDQISTKLANVEFTVKATSGEKQGQYVYLNSNGTTSYSATEKTVKTNSKGTITLNNLWVGKYEIVEKTNPNYGYLVNNTKISVTVTKRGNTDKTIANEYNLGNLKIKKVDKDQTSTKLANVEFTVKATSGEKQGQYVYLNSNGTTSYSKTEKTVKTNSNGTITLNNLWVGKYEIVEKTNPNYGYLVSNTKISVAVTKRGNTQKTISNEYNLGKLIIEKVDKDQTSTKLANVEFTVKATSGEKKGQYVYLKTDGTAGYSSTERTEKTNSQGRIEIDKVWIGSYQVVEKTNPNYGYIVDATPKTVTVTKRGTNVNRITNEYKLGSLIIEKVDKDQTSTKHANVEFTIKATSGEKQGQYVYLKTDGTAGYSSTERTVKTNSQGRIKIDKVWIGNYQVTEKSNPNAGYTVDATPKTVTVTKRGTNVNTITNEYKLGSLVIEKVDKDQTTTKLPNVEFTIKATSGEKKGQYVYQDQKGNTLYSSTQKTVKTGAKGTITLNNLWVGNYQIVEKTNPNYGYTVDATPTLVTITKRKPSKVTITNEYKLGSLKIEKIDKDTQSKLPNVEFTIKATSGEKNGQYVYLNSNGTAGYSTSKRTVKTNSKGLIEIDKVWVGNYEIIEVSNPNYGYVVNRTPKTVTVTKRKPTSYQMTNEYLLGSLSLEKVDQDNNSIKLPNVEFTIKAISGEKQGQYVYLNSNGTAGYSTSKRTVKTNAVGKIEIEKMWVGKYQITEVNVSNTDYGYVVDSTVRTITITKRQEFKSKITNRRVYVKLSGYVWQDVQSQKQSQRNDLYRNDSNDTNDILLGNITVRLKKGNTTIKQTSTDKNGKYLFEDVLIDELSNYYIEFEYDGLKYENVSINLSKGNGSKASEGSRRQTLNNKFGEVRNGESDDSVMVISQNGDSAAKVQYNLNPETASATIGDTSIFKIKSTTDDAKYDITYKRGSGVEEIKNINLGLYLRTQADLALMQDLDNVKVEVAGNGHIYKYANRFEHLQSDEKDYTKDAWNVGVRFQNEYSSLSYTRPIYKADAYYGKDPENPVAESEKLKVYLTYKIAIRNEETIAGRVNKIVDYYDSRYEISAIGTSLDQNTGVIGNQLRYTKDNKTYENGKYSKVTINTNILVDKSISNNSETAKNNTQKYVYIQFLLTDDVVIDLLKQVENNNVQRLENIAEISSYTSFYDLNSMKLYAALDKDSVPENATPGRVSTYEDDTDKAPTIALTIANARQITGTIFEDNAQEDILAAKNIRQGNGIYENGESKIGGVKVQLLEVDSTGNITDNVARVFNEQTNQWQDSLCESNVGTNGKYTLEGFAPGRYAIKYIWGDGTYKIVNGTQQVYQDMVENYKATNISEQINNAENSSETYYIKVSEAKEEPYSNKELSHALDNYALRQQIDQQLNTNTVTADKKGYNYTTTVNINEMTSTTPKMRFSIELYDAEKTNGIPITYSRLEDKVRFTVDKMSFGIIKRPIQRLNITKTLQEVKLTLPNGQALIDAKIDENGNLQGQVPYISYIPPTNLEGNRISGQWRIELDEELIQGSTVEMTYRFTTENTSETDYNSQGFYNFGEEYYTSRANEANAKLNDLIGISPLIMVDYLDTTSVLKNPSTINTQYGWQKYLLEDLKNSKLVTDEITKRLQTKLDTNGEELKPVQIFVTQYYKDNNILLKPSYYINSSNNKTEKEKNNIYMETEKVLSTAEDANFINQLEIVLLSKPGGSKLEESIPGNYIPNFKEQESDDAVSEELIITPNTGENRNILMPIVIITSACVILVIGIGLIIVKVVKKKENEL